MTGEPNLDAAREQYRRIAARYDRRAAGGHRYRRRAVTALRLAAGDTVLDVACGTGANFSLVEERIGPSGSLIGVDASPEMLDIARHRADRHGFENVALIETPIEELELSRSSDAALFSLTHDVLQSHAAVDRVVAALRPGARVASFGAKWARGPAAPLVNSVVRRIATPYVTTFAGFDEPWRLLAERIPDLQVEDVALGGAYVAWGSLP